MKKKVNQRSVIMTSDYTNKSKGLVFKCDVALASHLVQIGVAKLSEAEAPKKAEPKKAEPKKEVTKPKTKKK